MPAAAIRITIQYDFDSRGARPASRKPITTLGCPASPAKRWRVLGMDSEAISKDEGIYLLIGALRDCDLGVEYAPGTQYSFGYNPFATARSWQECDNDARDLWREWRFGRNVLWSKFKRKYLEAFSREPWRKEPAIESPGSLPTGAGMRGTISAEVGGTRSKGRELGSNSPSHKTSGRKESYDATALRAAIEARLKEEGPFPSLEAFIRWCLEPERVKLRKGEKPPPGKRKGDPPDRHTLTAMISRHKLDEIPGLVKES
jgi:hypothetical protein